MGTVLVRYVGLRSPVERFGRDHVIAAIESGRYTEADVDRFNSMRFGGPKPGGGHFPILAAVPGVAARALGPAEGLSRTYVWGPEPWRFVLEVDADDWSVIQALPEAAHFEEES